MPRHDARAVANRFIELGQEGDTEFTQMQLQKLVYIAHGLNLALNNGEQLIREQVQAWDWGPVIPEIYDALKRYGATPVSALIHENEWRTDPDRRGPVVVSNFEESEQSIIRSVYNTYGKMSGAQLSALTHEEGSPWRQVYSRIKRGIVIPNDIIENHYRELVA